MSDKDSSNLKLVGKIKDAHGIKGELYVLIFSKDTSWHKELKTFVIAKDESRSGSRALTIEKAKPHKDGLIIKTKEINDRNQSEAIKGQLFFISEDLLSSDDGETIYLSEIEGFEVQAEDGAVIGEIEGFSTNNIQDLLVVNTGKKTVEIPFVEAFIVDIDYEAEVIVMDLPPGLLTLDEKE